MDGFGFQWHITDRCHGRCRHCYQSRFDDSSELSLDALKCIAGHIMASVDVPITINVTGGEPLLYQYNNNNSRYAVFELMAHLSSFDNLGELNIITSTRGMDASAIDGLKAVSKLTSVKVSLESDDPQVNDDIRGFGHFDMVSNNIEALARAGIHVTVMATLGRHNYHTVEGLCRLAAGLGARGVILERFVPLGNGAELTDTVLTRTEWVEIINTVCRIADMDIHTDELLPYRAFRIDMPRGTLGDSCEVSGAPCSLGPSSMALMPDGTVYPCRRCPVPVGKLPHDGMGRILDVLSGYLSHSQKCFDFDF